MDALTAVYVIGLVSCILSGIVMVARSDEDLIDAGLGVIAAVMMAVVWPILLALSLAALVIGAPIVWLVRRIIRRR